MTDRELLELAAKAAGIEEGIGGAFWTEFGVFDPLTDDGDALRLAVEMLIELYHAYDGELAAYAYYPSERGHAYAIEPHGNNPGAATRRAITRAAAEIGRNM